ncbi:alpha,alpha-trehalose-phosphate synthase (UDP-forming) [Thalassobaculum fulvum]|uniref:alpha,alpha-trehalose-phosphate synthase (UDP-forming) n=1 Tax=Thalassobaculum fulvum TaxID=1633335 RepID=UPI00167436E2|nr:trehalose-6-phosphate synthase [Thalassobaculum fulvum]
MRRVLIASNRVPPLDGDSRAGGLAIALRPVLAERGGLWLGWSGRTSASPAGRARLADAGSFAVATLDLTEQERSRYYDGMANCALWPVLHGRLDLARFDYADYTAYRTVNRRFADALLAEVGPTTSVWVHDYHLMPLGRMLRNRCVRGPIGFFLHVPFPPAETFAAMPWALELVDDLAAYDLVGFQTRACVQNFLDFVERHRLGRRVGEDLVTIGWTTVRVGAFPVGADTHGFAALAASPAVAARAARLRATAGSPLTIASVDRLDYSKGLAERFRTVETLLERHPEWAGQATLFQIAAPSRLLVPEYRAIQGELEALSGRINARFGMVDWTPIRLMHRTVDHAQVAALLRASRVGMVTPLRDGMNLVAKEFVAAQDPDDPGVLVLSRFASAAEELPTALQVNPHDVEATARELRTALQMPLDERRERWRTMMEHLAVHDVHRWGRTFLETLSNSRSGAPANRPAPTGREACMA